MSVTVRHLNADSTFLLIFSPEPHPTPSDLRSTNGAYTVLIDPWLTGDSIVSAPWFAITKHVIPSHIQHLAEIEEPDVVVVSQNKPDHCHKVTLLQLRPEGKTIIAAEPGAAKAIRSWNHFDPNRVIGLKKYEPKAKFGNLLRLRIPPLSPDGHAGEINISFIPAKNYMTGLHNAFGITYRAPTHTKNLVTVPTIDLPQKTRYFHKPMSPATLPPPSPPRMSPLPSRPMSSDYQREESTQHLGPHTAGGQEHSPSVSHSSGTTSSEVLPETLGLAIIPPQPPLSPVDILDDSPRPSHAATSPTSHLPFSFANDCEHFISNQHLMLPTPPDSPSNSSPTASFSVNRKSFSTTTLAPGSRHLSNSSLAVHPARPKPLSIIYAPHGLPLVDLQPYVQHHLVSISALPLTMLFHAFDHIQNPWYFGGNIMTGLSGGVQIAQALMARSWVSAHDELKDDQGLSVRRLKLTRGTAEEVRKRLWDGDAGTDLRQKGWTCDVRNLGVGMEMCVSANVRDLCVGMGNKRESRLMSLTPLAF